AAAPDRGAGPGTAAHGRGGPVLHRHPHAGVGHDQGPSGGVARTARGAPRPLRAERRTGRRRGGGPEAQGGIRRHRPPRPLLIGPAVRPAADPRTPITHSDTHHSRHGGDTMNTSTYTVTGMTCGHCVMSVTEEVSEVPGVTGVDVDLDSGRMTVSSDAPVDDQLVRAAVTEAGYQVADA